MNINIEIPKATTNAIKRNGRVISKAVTTSLLNNDIAKPNNNNEITYKTIDAVKSFLKSSKGSLK